MADPDRMNVGLGIGFAILGLLLVGGGVVALIGKAAFVHSAERARGVVRDSEQGPFHTVVEFTAADGQQIEFRQNGLAAHSVGDTVDILYPPENPDAAFIDDPFDVYGWESGGLVMGGAFLLLGVGRLVAARRSAFSAAR